MGDDRAGGIEDDGVAHRALAAGQHRAHLRRVGLRVTTQQVVEIGSGKTESGGVERQLVHRAGLHPPDRAGGGRRQFVEPVVAVHHQHTGSASGEHAGHHLGEVGEGAADQPGPRPGRIGKRPKEIEDRRYPDLAAHRRGVPVGRVEQRREAEADADLGEAACDLLGPEVDPNAERLERVGAAGQRRGGPVAVFDHRHPGSGGHDGRHGGQVHGVDAVATGTDDVDRVVADGAGGHRQRVVEHHLRQLDDFGRGGNLHLHRDREGRDLGGARLAGHDLVHGPGRLPARQVLTAGQTRQDPRPRWCGRAERRSLG
ncbi:hypothetical protein A5686_18380 [Mycobacterium sp. E2479]|nr:hypothetical protein A5686_18380 [Mycobacterium sp. E2479]